MYAVLADAILRISLYRPVPLCGPTRVYAVGGLSGRLLSNETIFDLDIQRAVTI